MIERAKFDGCPVRDKGLQQVGEGGFTQVVLVGRDADGAKNGDDSDNHHDILLFTVVVFRKIE